MSTTEVKKCEPEILEYEQLDNNTEDKIFCANCIHCKLVQEPGNATGQFYLRVKCDQGKWKKKLGGEKLYKYFTVTRRSIDSCDSYEPMGDATEFISDLRKTLPTRDELYHKD
ncbi:MAG TPA: hypothetical protein VJ861_03895 [Treponemataceae bacterium]|nr:hypothetical protein [Treponemataceae bacterium]